MGNDIFDSEQSRTLESLMTEAQKSKLKEAILKKLIEKKEEEQSTASESITESKEETPPAPLTGTEKYTSTIREHVSKKSDNRQKVIREKTDLLAGDESVTAAQLRQSNSELWQRVQTSLASLGGGGLGERDVIKLIEELTPNLSLDSDDLAAIIPGILDGLTTDEVPEGIINLYYTDQRVWNSITSADGIVNLSDSTGELYINIDALVDELNGDSSFESALDSAIETFWALKTTDSLPEGVENLYWTDARFDSAFNKAIDSALEDVFDSLSANFDSSLFDRITLSTTDSLPEGLVNLYWTDARFDSAFTEALGGQTFDSAVDSALLEIIKDSNSEILDRLTLETTDSLPEGLENLYYTQARVDSDINSALGDGSLDSALTGIFDSNSPNFNAELWAQLKPLENTDSLPEGATNLYYTDERVEALVDSAYVNARVDLPETQILNTTDSLPEGDVNFYWTEDRFDSALKENIDSAVSEILQDSSSTIYQELTLENTDSLPEGSTNLYYTDQRVQDKIDGYVDNAFLTDKIALDDLSDVTAPAPASNQYLQYNGAVWEPANLDIDAGVSFKGTIDAVDSAAPGSPNNGDMYINTGSGAADASWTGLTNVDSDEQLIWGSDQASWFSFGGKADAGVVEVREGIAILVADSDAARPTVSVDKTVTDTWYYTKAQVDSSLTEIKDSLQLITGGNDSDITVLNNTKVDRAGDTMTGDLTLPQDPTNPLHAATKQYVDGVIGPIDGGISVDSALGNVDSDLTALETNKVDRDGDTMTDFLSLHADPTSDLHAATKQYVDAQITQLDSAFDSDIAILASATTDLTDVDSSGPSHGQILWYDSDAGQYTPVDMEQAGGGVAHHDSVPPATPFTNGQFWFSTKTTSLYVWHVNAWVKIGL